MKKTSYKKGFTLIELLIVIAIIGILASVVLVSLNSARQKARDSNYIAYISQVTKLVELATTSGEFDNMTTSRYYCLGDYDGGSDGARCWNGFTWNEPLVEQRLERVGSIPKGVSIPLDPYENQDYGALIHVHLTEVNVAAYTRGNSDFCPPGPPGQIIESTNSCRRVIPKNN